MTTYIQVVRSISITAFTLFAVPILAQAQSPNSQVMANNPCSAQMQAFIQATQKSGSSGKPDQSTMQSSMQSTAEGQALQACLDANPSAKPSGAPAGSARLATSTPPTQRPAYQIPSQTATTTGSCPVITRNISKGSRGADVSSLQTYLATDSSIYPEGSVTGYFGDATTRAVQRWQKANNLVSSGSPSTTGYGAVGPKTRAALAKCDIASN